jgi:MFS family permease
LGRALVGLNSGSSLLSGVTILQQKCSALELSSKYGMAIGMNSIGGLLGPFVGGLLFNSFGFSSPFLFSVIITAVDAVYRLLSCFILRGRVADALTSSASARSFSSREKCKFILQPSTVVVFIISFLNGLVMPSLDPILPLFLDKRLHTSALVVGIVIFTLNLGAAVGCYLGGKIPGIGKIQEYLGKYMNIRKFPIFQSYHLSSFALVKK